MRYTIRATIMTMHSKVNWRLFALKPASITVMAIAALLLISMIAAVPPVGAQDDQPAEGDLPETGLDLQILDIDTSEFPEVRVTVASADERGAPISDNSQLTLWENGQPVANPSIERIPTGVDATFVIDANPDIIGVDDDSGLTRKQKAEESIRRYANQYMSRAGLDRISIIVPSDDGQSGRFLLQDASRPEDVIAAVDGYAPLSFRETPLNEMLTLALNQVQERGEEGRFHPVLLFTDARRISAQLSYPLLTAQANESGTPIYVAILGAVADETEIENARGLFAPTRADYVHMPTGVEADPIYEIWQQQSNRVQIAYRSQQGHSGSAKIEVNFGDVQASDSFELTLQPPEVRVWEENVDIHRAGAAPDSALADMQPAVQPLTASISWPDGYPRNVSEVTLYVNDQPQTVLTSLPDGTADTVTVDWDISSLVEGEFELVVAVTDELGLQGTSAPLPARLTLERPQPPTAVPTAPLPEEGVEDLIALLPLESLPLPLQQFSWISGDLAAGISVVMLVLLVAIFWRNRDRQTTEERLQELLNRASTAPIPPEVSEAADPLMGRLEPFAGTPTGTISFFGDNLTIGSDEETSDIVVPHPSVAGLHARIRHQEDEYWLFDEGGAEGTYLNYKRLGLAPRVLQDGDVVQFGTVNYRFRLRPQDYQGVDVIDEAVMDEVVILDMDGLMVDTEPLSRRAWDLVLADLGCGPLDDAYYSTLIGHRLWETAEMLVARYRLPIESNELAWRKELTFAEIRSGDIPVMPGLYDLLDALKQRGIYWGVATSTPRHVAEEILTKIDVMDGCRALAAGDEVADGKPQPDVYLLAAERLNKEPRRCLVFEDSPTGCRAARAAGMLVVAVPNSKDMLGRFECADHIMTSLLDVPDHLDALLEELKRR